MGRSTSAAERTARALTVAAVASLSAGAIHAAAVGAHADEPRAAQLFIGVAAFQIAWGALALVRRGRAVALLGLVGNGVLFGGWVLARWKGLSFVAGLEKPEPVQMADALCAALALLSAAAAGSVLINRRERAAVPWLASGAVAVLALSSIPGMVEAGRHVHEGGATSVVVVKGKTVVVKVSQPVPPTPYDPKAPIDLGGVKGVSLAEQARAENLVAETVIRLPQWSDPAHAEASGFHSIHDGITGFEHFINWSYIKDDKVLDPDHPESLVYAVDGGKRTLVSAMFMLKPGSNLNTVPNIGGKLTQWHIHDNLCFTNDKVAPHVAGLTDGSGSCRVPLVKLDPVPMIHVWIVPQACGPFAALEGIGAGQVKPGEQQHCDHVHGKGL
ncbi:MAG: rane protein of unknown function [Acidimicrobiales bacterium]|nr:rane protein of unknown function [Acidimicrobiales bacterium]